ncbi:membrane-binding protein, partial [Microbacterium sp. ZXX196]|nr:membrane-binding protein [Microbacterium sp. ZXX196]
LNSEQEKLKADLKTKTQALDAKLNELQKLYAQLKKRIKIDIEQSQWKEFGIEDKK